MSVNEFRAWLQRELEESFEELEGATICRSCKTPPQAVTCFVSIHFTEFGDRCAGSGQVQQVDLPFCPLCETVPTDIVRSCVHIPMGALD